MTGRQKIERKLKRVRTFLFSGLALYLIPNFVACVSPLFALVALVGIIISIGALGLALNTLRCPECHRKLGNLLMIRQEGKMLALPRELTSCPHCAVSLDEHTTSVGLPEIQSTYEKEGAYLGVVDLPTVGESTRYELALQGKAREAFGQILRLHPFGKNETSGYRYFYVPRPLSKRPDAARNSMMIRVEKGDKSENVPVHAPPSLIALLEWMYEFDAPDDVTRLCMKRSS